MTTTTITYASYECEHASTPVQIRKSTQTEDRTEIPTLSRRAPRIGFTQLLPPLVIAWINNCNNTGVDILPTAIARIIQALVLVGLLSTCGGGESGSWCRETRRGLQVFNFFIQALCVLLVIDLLRLDPNEAQALVSTTDWRDGTAKLFRR